MPGSFVRFVKLMLIVVGPVSGLGGRSERSKEKAQEKEWLVVDLVPEWSRKR